MSVTTYYLQITDIAQLKAKTESRGLQVKECTTKQWEYNRFLYTWVGKKWRWFDKLKWSDEEWQAYAEADDLRTWVGYVDGSPAGFFELNQQAEAAVEIVTFGLASNFIGKGYGGYFLSEAIKSAFAWDNAQRVWLHTCTLDHPSALNNYQSRGFQLYKTETGG